MIDQLNMPNAVVIYVDSAEEHDIALILAACGTLLLTSMDTGYTVDTICGHPHAATMGYYAGTMMSMSDGFWFYHLDACCLVAKADDSLLFEIRPHERQWQSSLATSNMIETEHGLFVAEPGYLGVVAKSPVRHTGVILAFQHLLHMTGMVEGDLSKVGDPEVLLALEMGVKTCLGGGCRFGGSLVMWEWNADQTELMIEAKGGVCGGLATVEELRSRFASLIEDNPEADRITS